jgi:hypothetical protein
MAVASHVGRDWTQLRNREFEHDVKLNRGEKSGEDKMAIRVSSKPDIVAGPSRESPTPGLPLEANDGESQRASSGVGLPIL